MAMTSKQKKTTLFVLGGLLAIVGIIGIKYNSFQKRNRAVEKYDNPLEHFKYGSLGTEKRLGIPLPLFKVFPKIYADLLPADGPGTGYEKVGFIYEKGKDRPIGTSLRELPVTLVGLNCASCHTGTIREVPGGERQFLWGAPANNFNIAGYFQFLRKIGQDPRTTVDNLVDAIKKDDPNFGFVDGIVYRYFVLPETIKKLRAIEDQLKWVDSRPPFGPGRVDTFNPYKTYWGMDMAHDETVGTADFPALFNQRPRAEKNMDLHWDGNNSSVADRNISAAIGAGAEPDSLDMPEMQRVMDWIMDFQGPAFPQSKIDASKANAGKAVWEKACADCHSFTGSRVGKVTPIQEIGTDSGRLDSFTEDLAKKQNTLGTGYPWQLTHFKKTNGYANAPLDRVWLRAPYLHNGSIPTLRALLFVEERPAVFYRAHDVYDYQNVGFVSSGQEAEKGFKYDTSLKGNGNRGHTYGADLPAEDKINLLEYMKSL